MARETYTEYGTNHEDFAADVNLVLRAIAQDILGGRIEDVAISVNIETKCLVVQMTFELPVDYLNTVSALQREFPLAESEETLDGVEG